MFNLTKNMAFIKQNKDKNTTKHHDDIHKTKYAIKRTKRFYRKTIKTATFGVKKVSFSVVKLLIRFGLYKKILLLKLVFIIVPFLFFIVVDNFVLAFIMTIFNIFICAVIFSLTDVNRNLAMVNGEFDYGKYKYLKSVKETIAILLALFTVMMSTFFGHYVIDDIVGVFV